MLMLTVVILAAGKGTRMKSDKTKVLFEAAGVPMIDYVIKAAESLSPDRTIIVVGNGADAVREHLKGRNPIFCLQKEQLGTGDAVKSALDEIPARESGKVLILCGDMPLIKGDTLQKFIEKSVKDINFISVKTADPKGYGRVVRGTDGQAMKIVEEKDANPNEKKIGEINTGVYLCDHQTLREAVLSLKTENAQKEYYLTDIVKNGAFAYLSEDAKEFAGVNDRAQLASVSEVLRLRRAEEFMKNGVTIIEPKTFYVSPDAKIGKDTVIYPNVYIEKNTDIGSNCVIYPGCRITGSVIENNCDVLDNSLIEDSRIGAGSHIGPMAHIRPGSMLAGDNKVGNFVELKKTRMGKGSKASHLTYLGDAELGKDVNVGCGTITCNYDGFNKFNTVIGDDVFIGSDVQLVAPVNIGSGALIAAGTTVTKDVPEDALAISRTAQANLEKRGKLLMEANKAKKR